jgi:hypothetical protein
MKSNSKYKENTLGDQYHEGSNNKYKEKPLDDDQYYEGTNNWSPP